MAILDTMRSLLVEREGMQEEMLGVAGNRFLQGGGSMFGALAAVGNLGGILMPWVIGAAADVISLKWGMALT